MTLSNTASEQTTGLPPSGEPVFLVVGRLRRPHGVNGEILMEVITDFPERLRSGMTVYAGEDHLALKVRHSRPHENHLLLTFEGVADRDAAGVFRNELLYVRAGDIPALPAGEYYHHQILGLRVIDEGGEFLGSVVDILETGANDVFVVRPPHGPDFLVPMIDAIVLQIDLDAGDMRVHLLEGLI